MASRQELVEGALLEWPTLTIAWGLVCAYALVVAARTSTYTWLVTTTELLQQSKRPLQDISPPKTKVGAPDYILSPVSCQAVMSLSSLQYLAPSHLMRNGELVLVFENRNLNLRSTTGVWHVLCHILSRAEEVMRECDIHLTRAIKTSLGVNLTRKPGLDLCCDLLQHLQGVPRTCSFWFCTS